MMCDARTRRSCLLLSWPDTVGMSETDGNQLRLDELVPAEGGEWGGLLFDNPRLSVPPRLTWSFAFAFADVDRDYGDSPVSVDIDWVPLPTRSWRTMAGQSAQRLRTHPVGPHAQPMRELSDPITTAMSPTDS